MGRLKWLGNKTKHPMTNWEKYEEGYERIFGMGNDIDIGNNEHNGYKAEEST